MLPKMTFVTPSLIGQDPEMKKRRRDSQMLRLSLKWVRDDWSSQIKRLGFATQRSEAKGTPVSFDFPIHLALTFKTVIHTFLSFILQAQQPEMRPGCRKKTISKRQLLTSDTFIFVFTRAPFLLVGFTGAR